jgi:hypothetical protein
MASVRIETKRVAPKAKNVVHYNYGIINPSTKFYPKVSIDQTLPFRVKFTSIGIPSYNAANPAPIGIAIVGYNNYIL